MAWNECTKPNKNYVEYEKKQVYAQKHRLKCRLRITYEEKPLALHEEYPALQDINFKFYLFFGAIFAFLDSNQILHPKKPLVH
jgi:hypothetical protein